MSEDLFDHYRVFDAGNDLGGAAAFTAGLDVDIEYTLQSLRSGHRCPALSGRLIMFFIGHSGFVALTSPRGRYQCTVLAGASVVSQRVGWMFVCLSRHPGQCPLSGW